MSPQGDSLTYLFFDYGWIDSKLIMFVYTLFSSPLITITWTRKPLYSRVICKWVWSVLYIILYFHNVAHMQSKKNISFHSIKPRFTLLRRASKVMRTCWFVVRDNNLSKCLIIKRFIIYQYSCTVSSTVLPQFHVHVQLRVCDFTAGSCNKYSASFLIICSWRAWTYMTTYNKEDASLACTSHTLMSAKFGWVLMLLKTF